VKGLMTPAICMFWVSLLHTLYTEFDKAIRIVQMHVRTRKLVVVEEKGSQTFDCKLSSVSKM
jgi:hypothetical protein